jgi:hypothetical protein
LFPELVSAIADFLFRRFCMLIHRQPLGCFSSVLGPFITATEGRTVPTGVGTVLGGSGSTGGRKNRNRQLDAFAQAWFHSQAMDLVRKAEEQAFGCLPQVALVEIECKLNSCCRVGNNGLTSRLNS